MTVELIDVQCSCGGYAAHQRQTIPVTEVLSSMDRLSISGALLHIAAGTQSELDIDPPHTNDRLYDFCRTDARLVPCPIVLPAWGDDLPPERDQVDACIRAGAAAVRLRPARDGWNLADWCAKPLFAALCERRMPAWCGDGEWPFAAVADAAGRYPEVPFIITGVPYREQRSLVALLSSFKNIYCSIGSNYTVHEGIEQIVRRLGAGQLLFGTGFPNVEPAMAVAQLMYAGIDEADKALIGAGNFRRLQGSIA